MKAPDKIYLQQYDTDTVISLNKYNIDEEWTEVPINDKAAKNIEYIRKDIVDETIKTAEDHAYFAGQEKFREQLIEWLDGKMTVEGATEGIVGGYDLALKDVINKVNSI